MPDMSGWPDFAKQQFIQQYQQANNRQLTGGVNTTGWDPGRVKELLDRQQASGVQGTTIESPWTNFQATPGLNYGDAYGTANANAGTAFANQQSLVKALQAQASGTGGPSAAQAMLQTAQGQNANATASAVASNRSLSPAQAARIQTEAGAANQNNTAGQAAILRAQEQLSAQQQLGSVVNTQAGQQLGAAGNAGQLADQQNLGVQGINAGVAQANLNANFGQQSADVAQQGANWGPLSSIAGGGASGAGSALSHIGTGGGGAAAGGGGGAALGSAGPEALLMAMGGKVPGRAAVPGNSPKNDTVPADLSPGEIVVPRSAAEDPDRAAAFVRAVLRKQSQANSPRGYGAVLAKQREMERRVAALEGAR